MHMINISFLQKMYPHLKFATGFSLWYTRLYNEGKIQIVPERK